MADEYIRKHDAIVALMDNDIDHIQAPNGKEAVQILSDIPAADVVSKADITALLEETEKELAKGTDDMSIARCFIVSIMGIVKCKIMQMGEKKDG